MAKKEFLVQDDSSVLKDFIKDNSEQLENLAKDSKTAQVRLQILHQIKSVLNFLISCFCFDLRSGGVWFCGGVFWRESQNYTAGHVFPNIWTLHKGL